MNTAGRLLIVLSLLFIAACSKDSPSYSLMADTDTFTQTNGSGTDNKIDMLFVIGDEPAMSSKQAALVASMSTFMTQFLAKGFDFRLAVVTTSGYLANPAQTGYITPTYDAEADFNDFDGTTHSTVFVIDNETPDLQAAFAINAKPSKNTAGQDSRPFSSFRQALETTHAPNLNFHRADAFLGVVIVSNSEDYSDMARGPGQNWGNKETSPTLDLPSVYKTYLETFTGSSGANAKFSVSAMTVGVAPPCQGSMVFQRTVDLVNATGGIVGNICAADFGPDMVAIGNQIASLATKFILEREPVVSSIVVKVNGNTVPQDATNGWTYDATFNAIMFHGSWIPATGDLINVDYDPTTIL